MTERNVFLEKAKLIEMVALNFGINTSEVRQYKRKSIMAVGDKLHDDYDKLMCKIAFFVCHDKEEYNGCDCGECKNFIELLNGHAQRCLSLYDFIISRNICATVPPHVISMAFLDYYILPYLSRFIPELQEKFQSNRILHYLNEYIAFLLADAHESGNPLRCFLRKHTRSLLCDNIFIEKDKYRIGYYQPWSSFVEETRAEVAFSLGDIKRIEAFGWHCAGGVVHQLLKPIGAAGQEHALWGKNKAAVSRLKGDMDFIYDTFLSLNIDTKNEISFDNIREYRYQEANKIIDGFEQAISGDIGNVNQHADLESNDQYENVAEINHIKSFCDAVLNGVPTEDHIKEAERGLKASLKLGCCSRHTSLLAWSIFIAKCKHNKIRDGRLIQYCESKITPYLKDYINWNVYSAKSKLKNRAAYADFKNDMLCRLGYIRVYNLLVAGSFEKAGAHSYDRPPVLSLFSQPSYAGKVINPFIEIGMFIDNLIEWKDCFSFSVKLHERNISKARKKFDESLSWLLTANDGSVPRRSNKMKLCIMCAVKLYPEVMTLAGLAPSKKYTWLKPQQLDELIRLLGPCRCQEANGFTLKKNPEAEGWGALAYKIPITI